MRIGFGDRLYYNFDKEPPKPYSNYESPYNTLNPKRFRIYLDPKKTYLFRVPYSDFACIFP